MVVQIDGKQYKEVIQNQDCLVVLGASWCKDCVRIEPFLKDLSLSYEGKIQIYKIDSGLEEELSGELGIRAIPTLIFYRGGVEVGTRLVEPESKQKIEDAIKQNFELLGN